MCTEKVYNLLIFFVIIRVADFQISCSNFEDGIDRTGPWYAHLQSVTSVNDCCTVCKDQGTKCQSWTFVNPGGVYPPGCYLKENIPSINEQSNCKQYCTSGFKETSLINSNRCTYPGGIFELAIDRPGNMYARLTNVRNFTDCCALCELEGNKCRAWTFIRRGAPNKSHGCELKNSIPSISNTPCVPCTSGTK